MSKEAWQVIRDHRRDADVLVAVLRRFAVADQWVTVRDDQLTLDGRVDITPDEAAAIKRILDEEAGDE